MTRVGPVLWLLMIQGGTAGLQAAPRFSGEVVSSSAGTWSTLSGLEAAQALRTELALRTSWSEARPRLAWSLSLAGKVDLEPLSSQTSSSFQGLSPRLLPVLGATLTWQGTERLSVSLAPHAQLSLGRADLLSGAAGAGEVDAVSGAVSGGEVTQGLGLTEGLPQGLAAGGVELSIKRAAVRGGLVAGLQADRSLPLTCTEPDPALEALGLVAGRVGSEQLGLRLLLERGVSEHLTSRTSISLRDDLSVQGACTAAELWDAQPLGLTRLLGLETGLSRQLEGGTVSVQAGVTALATRAVGIEVAAADAAESLLAYLLLDQALTVRPSLDVQLESLHGLGHWKLKGGASVSRLPGRVAPTWNLGADLQGMLPLGPTTALTGGVSILSSRTLLSPEQEGLLEVLPLRTRSAHLGLGWMPRWWVRAAVGWSLTARETEASEPALRVSAQGQAVFVSISLALEPGARTL